MKPRRLTHRSSPLRCLTAGGLALLLALGSGCPSRTILALEGDAFRVGKGGARGRIGLWDGKQWVYGDNTVTIPEGYLCLPMSDAELFDTHPPAK